MSGEMISVTTDNGPMSAYQALPESGSGPGLIVIQEVFGVNPYIQETADQYAAAGFSVLAPDLFWRLEPGVRLDPNKEDEFNRGIELMTQFDQQKGVADIQASISLLRGHASCTGKVGVVGFCLGGRLAYMAAADTDTDAAVSYYGVGIETLLEQSSAISVPTLLHIAEEDGFVPKDAQQMIIEGLSQPPFDVHVYPGVDHGFARHTGMHFDAAASALANERSLALLRQAL